MSITHDEWMAAVAEVEGREAHPDAMTSGELSKVFNCGVTTVRQRLRKLLAQGKAKKVLKTVTDTAGRQQMVPAYVLLKGKK